MAKAVRAGLDRAMVAVLRNGDHAWEPVEVVTIAAQLELFGGGDAVPAPGLRRRIDPGAQRHPLAVLDGFEIRCVLCGHGEVTA